MDTLEQNFLNELDNKLWKAADKLRSNMDAANYKHVVLGLIFLKYVSDAFLERQEELIRLFKENSEGNIYYLVRENYSSDEEYEEAIKAELEIDDYYKEKNIFWVPAHARWNFLKEKATLDIGAVLWLDSRENDVKLKSVSWLIDNAFDEIEKENTKLKGILNRITRFDVENSKLIGLINAFSDTSFTRPEYNGQKLELHSKDILGHVYEYFLGEFAKAEGKQGGQFYTPKSIVSLIIEMLEPYEGRVYDPAMGSGGFFVSSDKFIEEHAKEKHYKAAEQRKNISVYGQESNPTTWKLAAMNMAIRGIDFDFGKKNADSLALLLANGSMSSQTSNEGEIRKNIIEDDLVECMVALPGQLFTNTQIPACIWFLTKNKSAMKDKADRKGKTLFIDARNLGYMKDRVLRDFTREDIKKIVETYHKWQRTINEYKDEKGFCYSANIEEIRKNDYILTPGRYVSAADKEEDGEPFNEKMKRLTAQLSEQFKESARLEAEIKKNLLGIGYEV